MSQQPDAGQPHSHLVGMLASQTDYEQSLRGCDRVAVHCPFCAELVPVDLHLDGFEATPTMLDNHDPAVPPLMLSLTVELHGHGLPHECAPGAEVYRDALRAVHDEPEQ